MKIRDRIKHAWNAFADNEINYNRDYGYSSSRSNHRRLNTFNTGDLTSFIFNRIAMDVSTTTIRHVIEDENGDVEVADSGLNYCLNEEANIDQTHMQFIQDMVYSMFDEGVVAVVPVETTISPKKSGGYDIKSLRVGRITRWYPKHVEVDLYNDNTGNNEKVLLEKRLVAIIENPLYAVINSPNSTLKRLTRKLSQLDNIDEISSSGRLDLLLSVPYGIKTDRQRKMAEDRINEIESQLSLGRNGIAYIDGTEKVTQLNRPLNNQLPEVVEDLTMRLYNQLGLTDSIFKGTASESELKTYYARTIDPIVDNIVAELKRKFLTKTARSRGHTLEYYRDLFKFISIEDLTKLGDTLVRNTIASPNEIRRVVGLSRSKDPKADELQNPHMPINKQGRVSNTPIEDEGVTNSSNEEVNV